MNSTRVYTVFIRFAYIIILWCNLPATDTEDAKISRWIERVWIGCVIPKREFSLLQKLNQNCWIFDCDTARYTIVSYNWTLNRTMDIRSTWSADFTWSSDHYTKRLFNRLDFIIIALICKGLVSGNAIPELYKPTSEWWYIWTIHNISWIATGSVSVFVTCWLNWTLRDKNGIVILRAVYHTL